MKPQIVGWMGKRDASRGADTNYRRLEQDYEFSGGYGLKEPAGWEPLYALDAKDLLILELALKQQTERAENAEAELASLRWQEPVATLLLSYDGADFEMYYDNNKLRFEGMSMKLYAAAGAAPAALEMLRNILNTADAKRIFDRLSDGQGIGTDDGRTWLSARDLLQSRAVKDSLTTQADCRACVNRGRVNGLSQETYCESCVHEGRNWRKNHFLDAAGQRLLEGGE